MTLQAINNNQPHHLDHLPISERLIISIYDYTCNWPRPYIKAGYPVMPWDYEHEGDIFNGFSTLLGRIEEAIEHGYIPYGLIAAPPCTAISKVGAHRWPEKDRIKEDYPGFNGKGYFDSETQEAEFGVRIILELKAQIEKMIGGPLKFWALENPAGRMETLVPELKPYRSLAFQPCDYGDPYNKYTILWGEFNGDLPRNPVEPIRAPNKNENSMDHYLGITKLKYAKRAKHRNKTPKGFAKAFFTANP
jgi:hypothetical protein